MRHFPWLAISMNKAMMSGIKSYLVIIITVSEIEVNGVVFLRL